MGEREDEREEIRRMTSVATRLEAILPGMEKRLDVQGSRIGELSRDVSVAKGGIAVIALIGITMAAAFFGFGNRLAVAVETIAVKARVIELSVGQAAPSRERGRRNLSE